MSIDNMFNQYNLSINKNQSDKLLKYFEFLVEYNKSVNLTAITDKEGVYKKHFLDSLLIFNNINLNNKKILDLGAGAGFPSIPNAIMNESAEFTIVETLGKRCVFLEKLIKLLDINNVRVLNKRGEDISDDEIEYYDISTARAVAKANILLELLSKQTKIGGRIILPKARLDNDELLSAKKASNMLSLEYDNIVEYEYFNNIRRNLIFTKKSKTPKKFPRNFGQIKNKPLGEK